MLHHGLTGGASALCQCSTAVSRVRRATVVHRVTLGPAFYALARASSPRCATVTCRGRWGTRRSRVGGRARPTRVGWVGGARTARDTGYLAGAGDCIRVDVVTPLGLGPVLASRECPLGIGSGAVASRALTHPIAINLMLACGTR